MSAILGTVSYDFLGGSIAEKVTYGTGLTIGIGGHAVRFPSPKVSIIDMDAATLLMKNTEQDYQDFGGHPRWVLKNNAEKAWDILARKETYYVGGIANGDEAIMIEGGCSITKTNSSPTPKPNAIINGKVGRIDGSSGCIHFESDHDKNVIVESFVYIIGTGSFNVINDQLVMGPGAVLVGMKCDTHRKTDMSGLPIKQDYNGWIYAINSAGAGQISGPHPVYTL